MSILDEIQAEIGPHMVQGTEGPVMSGSSGIYHNYEGGGNKWDVIGGKIYKYDPNAVIPQEVLQAFPMASAQEVSNIINEDGPGNGAGKGSMKEGILSALAAAGAFYGAGAGINALSGGAGAAGASPAASAVGDASWGVNPAVDLATTDISSAGAGGVGGGSVISPAASVVSDASTVAGLGAGPALNGSIMGAAPAGGAAAGAGVPGGFTLGNAASVAGLGAAALGGDSNSTGVDLNTQLDPQINTTGNPLLGDVTATGDPIIKSDTGNASWDSILNGPLVPDTNTSWTDLAKKLGTTVDNVKKFFTDNPNVSKLIGPLLAGGLGVIGGAELAKSLSDLAAQQKAAEQARYDDEVRRQDAVRAEATARYNAEVAARKAASDDAITREATRYQEGITRQDQGIQRQTDAQSYDRGIVAPSQGRYEGSFQPGFTMSNDPGFMDALNQSSKATLNSLSIHGNPAGSPNAWSQSLQDNFAKMAYPALKDYRTANYNSGYTGPFATGAGAIPSIPNTLTGNLPGNTIPGVNTTVPTTTTVGDTSGSQAGGPAQAGSLVANSNIFQNLSRTAGDIFNPQQTLNWNDLVKAFGNAGSTTKGIG